MKWTCSDRCDISIEAKGRRSRNRFQRVAMGGGGGREGLGDHRIVSLRLTYRRRTDGRTYEREESFAVIVPTDPVDLGLQRSRLSFF